MISKRYSQTELIGDEFTVKLPEDSPAYNLYQRPQLEFLQRQCSKDEVLRVLHAIIQCKRQLNGRNTEPIQLGTLRKYESEYFWTNVIPKMLSRMLASKIGKISLANQTNLLSRRTANLTGLQVYLLMCHAFFQTLPDQIQSMCNLPFDRLYQLDPKGHNENKLKFLISYLSLATETNLEQLTTNKISFLKSMAIQPAKKLMSNVPLLQKTLVSFKPRKEAWDPKKTVKMVALQFISGRSFGQRIFQPTQHIDYNTAQILCHMETLVARLLFPVINVDEVVFVSVPWRYSTTTKRANEEEDYVVEAVNRRDKETFYERYAFIRQPENIRQWKLTQVKQWLHVAQGCIGRLNSDNIYLDLNNQSFGDREIEMLMMWIVVTATGRKPVVYLDGHFDELQEELMRRNTTIKDVVNMLKRLEQFRRETSTNISATDYILDFYLT